MSAARGGTQRLGKRDARLLAQAVAFTRVSYFKPPELQRLRQLTHTLTGYNITVASTRSAWARSAT
jgi:hypothetical protein